VQVKHLRKLGEPLVEEGSIYHLNDNEANNTHNLSLEKSELLENSTWSFKEKHGSKKSLSTNSNSHKESIHKSKYGLQVISKITKKFYNLQRLRKVTFLSLDKAFNGAK
jgi:hypothetical protein